MSNAVKAIIVAIVVVGAVAVLAAAISFNLFNRVTTVEENSGAIEAKIVTVDQKVDVVTKKIEELSTRSSSNLEPAVVALQINQDLSNLREKAEGNFGIDFSADVMPVLDSIRSVWPNLSIPQRDTIGEKFFSTFVDTSVLDSATEEESDEVWDLVDEVISKR